MSKEAPTEEDKVVTWFHQRAEPFLRSVGVHECLQVADIGCHKGQFVLPAARIVGSCGAVYAIDKDRGVLANVRQMLKRENRHNVKVIKADLAGDSLAPVAQRSIDLALLYDVLHRGYMPHRRERRNLLTQVHRILKPGGTLSCYPTHLRKYGFTFEALMSEIAEAGFALKQESRRRLVHDGRLVRGRLFRFAKPEKGGYT